MLGALAMDFAEGRPFRAELLAHRIAGAAMATMRITLTGWAVEAAKQVDMARLGRLVTDGPYTISRNPLYIGWHLLYSGLLIFTGSRWLLRLLPAVLVATHFAIRGEERRLLREVGMRAIPPEYLARIRVPATLIWGCQDRVMRLRIAEAANTHYGWPLHVIEVAGHICFADQPEAVLRALHASVKAM